MSEPLDEKDVNMDHDFDPGHTGMSDRCNVPVMRDGAADDCGLPRVHSAHGLDPWCRGCNPEGESVYAPCAKHAHTLVAKYDGQYACACGFTPGLGEVALRAVDRHLAGGESRD